MRGEDGQKGTKFRFEEGLPPPSNTDLDQPKRTHQPNQPPVQGWGQGGPVVGIDRGELAHSKSPQSEIVLWGTTADEGRGPKSNHFGGEATFVENTGRDSGEDACGDLRVKNERMVTETGMVQDGHGDKVVHGHQLSKTPSSTKLQTTPSSGQYRGFLASSGGGVQNSEQPLSDRGRKCEHSKDGVCSIHGEGAKKFPKLVTLKVRDKSGKEVTKTAKRYFFVCDLSLRRGIKLKQTRLSFRKTTNTEDNPGTD